MLTDGIGAQESIDKRVVDCWQDKLVSNEGRVDMRKRNHAVRENTPAGKR